GRIEVKKNCLEGGLCGKCICQLSTKTNISDGDKQRLTNEQLAQIFRLACQHRIGEVKAIIIHN
ncbi:MAG: ferredoxin, partial [Glaciecola sp.]